MTLEMNPTLNSSHEGLELPRHSQNSIRAAYYRGGTSRAVMLRLEDLPADGKQWCDIFRGLIGSPDSWGRQLDGVVVGLSSLSKVCVVGPSTHPEADVDYTFAAIGVKDSVVDLSANCGNMTSAVGPFAVDSGSVAARPDEHGLVTVRILNTNTNKIIHAKFPVQGDEAAAPGDFSIDGVHGSAAKSQLTFIRPGGSKTGRLLPTGSVVDVFDSIRTTCIDAGYPCCFVQAEDVGLHGTVSPADLDSNKEVMAKLELIRRKAGVKMGLAATENDVPVSIPKLGLVSMPSPTGQGNIVVRALSVGQAHRALPITVALSAAISARTAGTVVSECLRGTGTETSIVLMHPMGLLVVDAEVASDGEVRSATVYSTARRLMEVTAFWK
ncbi:3-methylitaconate isomerase [Colletotrichum plurivorum]|uniref:3-methylitaconate isomerase n=1 Tax=Colletotrichum plurivorum TaxID=2175906 RepID=A0A8H6N252_9PEZI|nr:3-methylitaconate isomerase [Colletotrichum plurivorum]